MPPGACCATRAIQRVLTVPEALRRRWRMLALVCGALAAAAHAEAPVPVGAEDGWYPYSGVVDGRPAGMAVDIVRAAFAAAGVQITLESLPYARCMRLAETGAVAACFDTLRNPLIEHKYLWPATPLFRGQIVIYAAASASDKPVALAALRGRRVGVTHGYEYGDAFDGDPAMVRDVGDTDLATLRKLVAGRVDYALVYDRVAEHLARSEPGLAGRFKPVGVLLTPDLYLSFSRDYPGAARLVSRFDAGMLRIRATGEYARIVSRWAAAR